MIGIRGNTLVRLEILRPGWPCPAHHKACLPNRVEPWDDMRLRDIPMASAITPENKASSSPMLVYDGSCGFCSRSVRFILRHERRHDLLFVTRDSELGQTLRRTHGLESIQSMVWIENGRAFAESRAVIKAGSYMGGWWSQLAALASFFPASILNRIYKVISKYRRRLSSNVAVCPVPTPEERRRFLA